MHGISYADFESLYNNQILPELGAAERVRKKIMLNYWIIGTVALTGFIVEAVTWMAIGAAAIILFIILYTRWYSIPVSRFEILYEKAITFNIIQFISSALTIDLNSHLTLNELKKGLIISGTPQYFGGSYLIQGNPDGIPIRISEIDSSSKMMSTSGSEKIHQYFNGLVATSPITTKLEHPILICTDQQLESNLFSLSDKIKIESHEGNELIVYCRSDEEFRKYVSAELLNKLKEFILLTGNNLIFSVQANGISLAILHHRGHQYLQPNVFRSAYTKQTAEIYFRDIVFITQSTLMAAKWVTAANN